uniref:Protein MIS12 homolog n=1 Tax=Sarcophilus harrisii TaxID=9305 RepID=A0A7N4PWM5_SARHA
MSVNPLLYETQFFGFTPQTCVLRIYIAFQDYLFEVMAAVEKVVLRKAGDLPGCALSAVQVRSSTEAFLRFMRERFDRLFVKMERALLRLVLSLPPTALLSEEFGRLRRDVERLQARYRAELGARRALLAELEVQKEVQARLRKVLHWLNGLGDVHGPPGLREMTTLLTQYAARKLCQISIQTEQQEEAGRSKDTLS